MIINKYTIACAALVLAGGLAFPKGTDELRIYINPGHGGWTADDRPCQLVNHPAPYSRTDTDSCSFFESNTDLEKGFGLLERLIDYGLKFDRTKNLTGPEHTAGAARDLEQNIVMSRVKNGPYLPDNATAAQYGSGKVPESYYWYNRSLTEIAEEVQANDFDMFISIHSNAANDITINYPLYLYRGYDDCRQAEGNTAQHQQISRKMAEACWDYGYENPHSYWTHFKTSKYIKGDIDFYGDGVWATRKDGTRVYGYLGALRHSVPGFLVEGFFHSYQPARHRAMNWDVCRVEGIAYAHGIADYFGLEKEKTGTIYGIVRDSEEKFTHQFYNQGAASDDVWMPLNDVTIKLLRDDKEIASYLTDDNYNGAFVFDGLEVGDYTLQLSKPGYQTLKLDGINVAASSISYPKVFLNKTSPYRKQAFAYGLQSSEGNEGKRWFEYSISSDAEKAELLIISSEDEFGKGDFEGIPLLRLEVEATQGHHIVTPDFEPGSDFRWGILVTQTANSEAGEIYSEPNGAGSSRGGVVPMTDPGQPTFGYTVVGHGNNNGFDIYNPSGEKVSSRLWRGNSLWGTGNLTSSYDPCRGNQHDGKAVFASWGDNACGLVCVDPLGLEEPYSLYSGTLQPGGHYIHEGRNLGGGISGLCFVGENENTYLYTFSEDHEGKNGNGATENSVVRYKIGTGRMIEEAPEVIGFKELLANTNVDLVNYGNGFFASQNRSEGMNTVTNPAFVYINAADHSITYSSALSYKELTSCTTGLAITADGRTLAVADTKAINICNVEWKGSEPVITPDYKIPFKTTQTWVNLRFDAGGNLHAYQVNQGYHVYALKSEGKADMFESPGGIVTGIRNILDQEEKGADSAPRYYDLTGRPVSGRDLSGGIYIKVTNGKAEKVII